MHKNHFIFEWKFNGNWIHSLGAQKFCIWVEKLIHLYIRSDEGVLRRNSFVIKSKSMIYEQPAASQSDPIQASNIHLDIWFWFTIQFQCHAFGTLSIFDIDRRGREMKKHSWEFSCVSTMKKEKLRILSIALQYIQFHAQQQQQTPTSAQQCYDLHQIWLKQLFHSSTIYFLVALERELPQLTEVCFLTIFSNFPRSRS